MRTRRTSIISTWVCRLPHHRSPPVFDRLFGPCAALTYDNVTGNLTMWMNGQPITHIVTFKVNINVTDPEHEYPFFLVGGDDEQFGYAATGWMDDVSCPAP